MVCLAVAGVCAIPNCFGDTIIEGFENGNLSNYTAHAAFGGGQTTAAVASTYAHDGSYGLGLDGDDWYVRNDSTVQLAQGERFSAWIHTPVAAGREYFGFGASPTSTYDVFLGSNTNQFGIQDATYSTASFTDLSDVNQTYSNSTWYKVVINWGAGGTITAQLFASNGTTLLNTVSANDNTITSGGIAFRGFDSGPGAFDTVTLVTTTPEPSTVTLLLIAGVVLGVACARDRRRTRFSQRIQ